MSVKQSVMAFLAILCTMTLSSQPLPAPVVKGGQPLMEMMKARCSSRDFDPKSTVTDQELSDMLWAAWGITHDGKRTVATARNQQELEIYVVTAAAVSRYSAETNSLELVNTGDWRSATAKQQFAVDAPLNIVFVADTDKQPITDFQSYAAGAASQNIYLYCAQAGLKTVVRAMFDKEALPKALKLGDNKRVLFVQTVGR